VLQALWAWLRSGFSGTALLLGSCGGLSANAVLQRVAAEALACGMQLGLSWLVVSSSAARDPLGSRQLPHAASSSKQPLQRPASRLGREHPSPAVARAAEEEASAPACIISASSDVELTQLLGLAAQQLQAATVAACSASQPQLPALVLRLALQAADGQPAAVLHVLQLASSAAGDQGLQEQELLLLKLLQEVADLHQRRREGGLLPGQLLVCGVLDRLQASDSRSSWCTTGAVSQ
jgi:hypothetical protein